MWRFGIDVMVEDGGARVGATRQVELRKAGAQPECVTKTIRKK